MKYRPEIDGLRAIAVLPVIFFHAGFDLFSGGYVGVDVFFVISGYLITSILILEKEANKFTLSGFYERRARRILPALFFVMLCSIPFAWEYMSSGILWDFWQSIISVSIFLSNFLFTLEAGYFAGAAENKPFLHTWSLAVEEQFYIIFPLFFVLLWGMGKKWLIFFISIIAIVSLLFAEFNEYISIPTTHFNRTLLRLDSAGWASFYLPFARAWELLLGVLIAFYLNRKAVPNNKLTDFITGIGVILILYAIFSFDSNTRYPSFYTLIPTLGTSLIILCGRSKSYVGMFLSNPVFVWTGLISYSAYLWHQPLFAFTRLASLREPSVWLMVSMIIATFSLAYCSWRFIEKPFRSKNILSRQQIFVYFTTVSILFVGIGFAGLSEPVRMQHLYSLTKEIPYERRSMVLDKIIEGARGNGAPNSDKFSADASKKILLIGDSQTGNWNRAYFKNAELFKGKYEFRALIFDGLCYSYLEPPVPEKSKISRTCKNQVYELLKSPLLNKSDQVFVLEHFNENSLRNIRHLIKYLKKYKGKITLVGNAEFTDLTKVSLRLAKQKQIKDLNSREVKRYFYFQKTKETVRVNTTLKAIANKFDVKYFSEYELYCNSRECELLSNDYEPYMYDTMHVTEAGAKYLGKVIFEKVLAF